MKMAFNKQDYFIILNVLFSLYFTFFFFFVLETNVLNILFIFK